jgi:hypothetical protein
MATKNEEIRFTFDDEDNAGPVKGKAQCDICYGRFTMPEVVIRILDFDICPSCIISGPAAVATEAENVAGDKKRLIERWGKNPEGHDGIVSEYRAVAKALRSVKSFKEIRGGEVSLAIAAVRAGNGSRPDEWAYTITRVPRTRGKAA